MRQTVLAERRSLLRRGKDTLQLLTFSVHVAVDLSHPEHKAEYQMLVVDFALEMSHERMNEKKQEATAGRSTAATSVCGIRKAFAASILRPRCSGTVKQYWVYSRIYGK